MKKMIVALIVGLLVGGGSAVAGTGAQAAAPHSCVVSGFAGWRHYSGWVTASYHTSCPFARRVTLTATSFIIRAGGAGDGSFYVRVWSPVTGHWYRTACSAYGSMKSRVTFDCRAGIGARVRFWAAYT